eukprot:SAG31_NODE_421_length_15868_cov_8.966453_14_plen_107_part_00
MLHLQKDSETSAAAAALLGDWLGRARVLKVGLGFLDDLRGLRRLPTPLCRAFDSVQSLVDVVELFSAVQPWRSKHVGLSLAKLTAYTTGRQMDKRMQVRATDIIAC